MAKTILVIDDEELVTKSLAKLLTSAGYNVIVVHSGVEAIQKVQEADFDLIISDIRMPELDGIETIRQIRSYLKRANKKKIPEILITGYADKDKYEIAVSLQISDYLYKPFDRDYLLQVVKRSIH
jgi:CheY-like chemotaxis protein